MIEVPSTPLTTETRTQLITDIKAALASRAPSSADGQEIYALVEGLLFLIEDQAPPPPP